MLVDMIGEAIYQKGGKPYIVGGFVRDTLANRTNKNVDIEVFRMSMREVMNAVGGLANFRLVGKNFPILHTRDKALDLSIDISIAYPVDTDIVPIDFTDIDAKFNVTVENAMKRRDFTINAMYMDMRTRQVVDYFNGAGHLREKFLDIVDDNSFGLDPLRVLRGMQLAARYKLRLSSKLGRVAKNLSSLYDNIPKERIWEEWYKWATQGRELSKVFDYLKFVDWLWLYPELDGIREVPQDPEWHPEGDVTTHTSFALDCIREVARTRSVKGDDRAVLVLTILCHDLGKATTTKMIDGRWRALGHEQESVRLAKDFLNRIGCPSKIKERVLPLVGNHMFPIMDNITRRQVRRLRSRLEPATVDELADIICADKATTGRNSGLLLAERAINMIRLSQEIESTAQPILTGRHILDFGIKEGKEIGRIKREAFEAQLEEEFSDEAGALEWLYTYLKEGTKDESHNLATA